MRSAGAELADLTESRVQPAEHLIQGFRQAVQFIPCPGLLKALGKMLDRVEYTTSEGKELWCLGDLIHFGAVQFPVRGPVHAANPRSKVARHAVGQG